MAVKIRLKRLGEKKSPFYRIIVADSSIDAEAAKKWLANGAQPTEVVGKLFKMAGIEK